MSCPVLPSYRTRAAAHLGVSLSHPAVDAQINLWIDAILEVLDEERQASRLFLVAASRANAS